MQVIVLGMHRSGTSTVTRLINMMGAHVGSAEELIGSNHENPKGFWERRDVIDANEALLAEAGCNWYTLGQWHHNDCETPAHFASQALQAQCQNVVNELNFYHHWVMKDPRLCHTLPFWLPLLKNPVLIIVYRYPLEIAQSLKKRNDFMFQHSLAIQEYATVGMLNAARKLPHFFVRYSELMEDPIYVTRRIYDFLFMRGGALLELPKDEDVVSFVEPSLYRSKTDVKLNDVMTPYQIAINRYLATSSLPEGVLEVSFGARELIDLRVPQERLQENLESTSEVLSRAMETVNLQEARIVDLVTQIEKLTHRQQHLQRTYEMQLRVNRELQDMNHELGKAAAELEMIKQTRVWKLRNMLVGNKHHPEIVEQ